MLVGAKPRALRPRAARSELVPNTRVLARSTGARASSRPPRRPAWRASRRPYPRVIQLDDFETANHQPFRDHRAIDRVGVDAQDFGAKGGASEAGLMKRRFLWCGGSMRPRRFVRRALARSVMGRIHQRCAASISTFALKIRYRCTAQERKAANRLTLLAPFEGSIRGSCQNDRTAARSQTLDITELIDLNQLRN